MGFHQLPLDVFYAIIDDVLTHSTWSGGLQLRSINRWFDHEIQAAYFDRMSVAMDQGPRKQKTPAMTGLHLYRYLKGQISTWRPKSKLAANLQGAVDVLDSVKGFSWDAEIQVGGLHAPSNTVRVAATDKYDRIQALVALTACTFLNDADFASLNRLTWYNTQALPQGWAMMTAIMLDDKPTVEALLARQPAELKMFHLSDPLRMAIKQGNAAMARLLLTNGACVNMYSIYYNPEMGYRMILHDACVAGNTEMVRLLLEPQYGMQTDSEEYEMAIKLTVEKFARDPSSLDVCERIIRMLVLAAMDDVRSPLLHYLVDRSIVNHANKLVLLAIKLGFDVNNKGDDPQSPLVHAVNSGEFEIATTLIDHGARPTHEQDHDAVREACRFGRVDMLQLLLTKSITLDEYGHAVAGELLLVAAQSSKYREDVYLQLLQCFVDKGLDLNAANWGIKALNLSVERNQRAVTKYLLAKGITSRGDSVMAFVPPPALQWLI